MSGNEGKRFDGYIRVSRVNGRSGDSYRSPGDQMESIKRTAQECGITLGEVVTEEDVSGGKRAADRELGRLVQKITDGESGGLVVWNVKRYSRNYADGFRTALDIFEAGGRIVSEDFRLVGMGAKSVLSFMLEFAEEELDQKRAGWRRAVDGAIARGVYVGRTPVGYERLEDGTLRKTAAADAVAQAFAVRAGGGSWSEVCRCMERAGVRTAKGEERWSLGSATSLLSHPVFKGTLKNGHEHHVPEYAVVTPSLWEKVQTRRSERPGRKDAGGWALLGGLVFCADCGRRMAPTSTTRDGKRYRYYQCRHLPCPAKATVAADDVEAYVLEQAASYFEAAVESGEVSTGRETDVERVAELEEAIRLAEDRRRRALLSLNPAVPADAEALDALDVEVEVAKAALTEELGASRVEVTAAEFRRMLAEATLDEKRMLVRKVVGHVTVRRGKEPLVPPEGMTLAEATEWTPRVEVDYRSLVW